LFLFGFFVVPPVTTTTSSTTSSSSSSTVIAVVVVLLLLLIACIVAGILYYKFKYIPDKERKAKRLEGKILMEKENKNFWKVRF
jgi:uncharacterized membrane protein YciS (DUF1049 family)